MKLELGEHRRIYHEIRRTLHKYRGWNGLGAKIKFVQKNLKVPRGFAGYRDEVVRIIHNSRHLSLHQLPVTERVKKNIVRKYSEEIERRGGETFIQEQHGRAPLRVTDRNIKRKLLVLNVDAWRYYSRRESWRARLSYLCGEDDNGLFAVRLPGTITKIDTALDFLEPAIIHKAKEDGRKVLRQGDVYVVEMKRDCVNPSDLPPRHIWNSEKRTLKHEDGHGLLHVPFPAKFVPQKSYEMGRSISRGYAD